MPARRTGRRPSFAEADPHECSRPAGAARGRGLTVPCPACGLATHHRTLDHDGAHTCRPQAGPGTAHVSAAQEPGTEAAWIALIPGDCPARFFAPTELCHLSGGAARPGPHPRDYGTAEAAHDACCPGLHATRPATSRGAGEPWRAMRLRLARHTRP